MNWWKPIKLKPSKGVRVYQVISIVFYAITLILSTINRYQYSRHLPPLPFPMHALHVIGLINLLVFFVVYMYLVKKHYEQQKPPPQNKQAPPPEDPNP